MLCLLQKSQRIYRIYTMNSANQMLMAIKNKKALLTKEKNEAIEYIESKYAEDMAKLDKEEREWLEQFDDVPINDIYKKENTK